MTDLTCECGLIYNGIGWVEYQLPDDVWNKIAPRPDGGGVLCISCASAALIANGHRQQSVPIRIEGTSPLTTPKPFVTIQTCPPIPPRSHPFPLADIKMDGDGLVVFHNYPCPVCGSRYRRIDRHLRKPPSQRPDRQGRHP